MRRVSLVLVVALALAPALLAEDVWVPLAAEASQQVRVDVVGSGVDGVELEVAVPGVSLGTVQVAEGAFTRFEVPGLGQFGAPGEPALPVLRRFVEVPIGAVATVDAQVLDRETVELAARGLAPRIMPVQLPQPKCDCEEARRWRFSLKPEAYRGMVEPETASLSGPFTFRDHTVMLLTVVPARYDAGAGRVEVASRIRVRVGFAGGDLAATRARKQRLASREFDSFLHAATVNLNFGGRAAGWHYPTGAPVELLVVAPDDAAMLTALQPFVDWKTSCGYHVNVVTTAVTGTTTTAIKSYIQGLYGGPNPPVYILMIGDSPSPIVTFSNSGGGYGGTDLPYVQMDADLYPDMIIARWPVDDAAELIAMRDKILVYEQPTADNSAWLNRALFLAGDDYIPAGVTTHETVMAQLMQPPPNSAECVLWYGDNVNYTTAQLIADLNSGRGWAVYSAHSGPDGWSGDPPLSSGDIASFGNTGMYPLGFGHSCSSNEWNNYPDVFGEAAVVTANKGFVSYWGASNSSYWDGDDWLERGFFDSFFDADITGNQSPMDRQYSQGAACYAGQTQVTLSNQANEEYYWYLYNLNGDPTLDPFTKRPVLLTVDVPPVVPPAANDSFTVTLSDAVSGPVPGGLVGVSQDGILLGAGYTDASGVAVFPIAAPTAGSNLLVRATAHNHVPSDSAVMVAAGSDGVVVLDRSIYRCDSVVGVDVFDDDLDGQGTINVTLTATPSGGNATLQLTEQPGTVVRFHGVLTLGAALVVTDGDTLTVSYYDQNTGGGSGATKTDAAVLDCAGPVIGDVASSAAEDSLTITFSTSEPGTTVVYYGTTRPPAQTVSGSTLETSHSVTIPGLDPCETYFYRVASADALGNLTEQPTGADYYAAQTAGWAVVMSETFDANPGWVINNNGNANGWAFGQPAGLGGQYGSPDPTAGHTGNNVYGVNLQGDYDNSLTDNQLQLEAPAVDCSDMTSVVLSYWYWLGVETPSYDHARVQVAVDGGAWTTVWENTATMDGGSWVQETLDLTSQAAGHASLKVRWTMGVTDSSWQFAGWNLDDVTVEGAAPCTAIFADDFESSSCSHWSGEAP